MKTTGVWSWVAFLLMALGFLADRGSAQVRYSQNILAYVDMNLAAGSNMVAHPMREGNLSVSNLFQALPPGSYLAPWDDLILDFGDINRREQDGHWTDGAAEIHQAQGVMVWVSQARRVSFVGSVVEPSVLPPNCYTLQAGPTLTSVLPVRFCGIFGAPVGRSEDRALLAADPGDGVDGAIIIYWDLPSQAFDKTLVYAEGVGWLNLSDGSEEQPTLTPGTAALVVLPQVDDYAPPLGLADAPTSSDLPLFEPSHDGSQFSVHIASEPNVEYFMLRTQQLDAGPWEVAQFAIGPAGGGALTLVDPSATASSGFYRVINLTLFSPAREGGTFRFAFESVGNRTYEVQRRANEADPVWTTIETIIAPERGGRVTVIDSAATGASGQYRLATLD